MKTGKSRKLAYRENEPMGGFDPYSNSKACSELVTDSYRKSFYDSGAKIGIATARAGNVIGGGDFAVDRLIPDCIRGIMKGRKNNCQKSRFDQTLAARSGASFRIFNACGITV